MRNRRRGTFNQKNETKRIFYISFSIILLAVTTFIVTYIIYSRNLNNKSSDLDLGKLSEYSTMTNETTSETSKTIGKSVNETIHENTQTKEESTNEETNDKIAINTSNIVKENNEEKNIIKETNAHQPDNKEEKIEEPTFIKPVEGEIIREFANENLVYSETLKEWITHNGIDIKADKASIVKASCDGTIKSIKNDPRYGISVIIEHPNGYQTVYANLLTAEFVKENETIKKGQTIGTVGNTAAFEIADESHLHFELLKDGNYLNPSEYIK